MKNLFLVKGIGHSKACTLSAVFEIVKRHLSSRSLKIFSPKEVHCMLSDYIHERKEYFIAIYLNNENELIHKSVLAIGTKNRAIIQPKDIFKEALSHGAGTIILAHNHPSGNVEPSKADIHLTKKLVESGNVLDIKIIDHVIISSNQYYSFYQNELIA